MQGRQIFRKQALAKLSSPEQLDQLITVTDQKGWISLLAITIIIIGALLWSITGEIPVTVDGNGIILRRGGRHKIISIGSGLVTDLKIDLDDKVKEGDVLAIISQPELSFKIEKLANELKALKEAKKSGEKYLQEVKYLSLEVQETREIAELYSKIKSPEDGHIVSLMIDKGDFVQKEKVVAIIEDPEKELESIFFIPLESGKKIKPGMKVQIEPSIVKSEEFGFMIGEVFFVSEFPATRERMMEILENDQLVDNFSSGGAPLEIHVRLEEDESTESGFKWSSGKGPQLKISSGTLCSGTVVLKKFHPISLVIPSGK